MMLPCSIELPYWVAIPCRGLELEYDRYLSNGFEIIDVTNAERAVWTSNR